MPKFSIIATDAENHVPREKMKQGVRSILDQTFDDYELLIIHDGPRENPFELDLPDNAKLLETEQFYGIYGLDEFYAGFGWGHHSRDMGIKVAKGDYILHFNIDNILYPNPFQTISDGFVKTKADVFIFA